MSQMSGKKTSSIAVLDLSALQQQVKGLLQAFRCLSMHTAAVCRRTVGRTWLQLREHTVDGYLVLIAMTVHWISAARRSC